VGTETGTSGACIADAGRSELDELVVSIGVSADCAGGAAGVTIGCAGTDASVEVGEVRTSAWSVEFEFEDEDKLDGRISSNLKFSSSAGNCAAYSFI
jgi:hypothetical protein